MQAFIALILVAATTASIAPLYKNTEPIPGKYIIKLRDDFDIDEVASTVRLSGGKVGFLFRHVLHGFAAELKDDILDIVRRIPAVEYVEQDGVYRTQVTWGLDRCDQRNLPLDNKYDPKGDAGNGITAYIIDTGIKSSHSDFGGRVKEVHNLLNDRKEDCNGHGTHCAGTVGSNTYGVAPGVQLVGVKVLDCYGAGSTSTVIAGVDLVAEKATSGKSVASMSLGGGASRTMDNAVEDLISKNVPTAVAAGNDNKDASNYSPARVESAYTVGATDSSDRRSSFSNYGAKVDLFAPGTSITSTWINNNWDTKTISGTSMATPHVAGAIAINQCDCAQMMSDCSNFKIDDCQGAPNKLLYVGK
ncbi:aqualysin-1-like [Lytechinus variegatus]|uniref:aqualysin-1-like n=1 Tax=Lytechinus variegatus TaxID=7654 RepID=UPI001BB22139|nr:aqualysin-1-like [Lytechinus variegatus]